MFKLIATKTEKQNLVYMVNEYIKKHYPGLASQEILENEITFGNPAELSGTQNYFNDHNTLLAINQDLDPNTEISVSITKVNYNGPKFSKIKYHRQNVFKTLPLFANSYSNFYGNASPNTVLTLTNGVDNKDKIAQLINNHMVFIKEGIQHARFISSENKIHVVFKENSLLYKGNLKIATTNTSPYVTAG